MRIAFYLPNKDFSYVDCSNPEEGNPGIGGTEYMIISIPYYLEKLYHGRHEYFVFANSLNRLPQDLNIIQVEGVADIPPIMSKMGIDLLVLKYSLDNFNVLLGNKKILINVAFWTHNFVKRQELTWLAKDPRVRVIICVGNEQLQIYRDHQAFYKSVVIFNGYPVEAFKQYDLPSVRSFSQRGHEVTYMGNLVQYKGFPLLAKAWKKIIAKIPDAHLNVIGGGKLYDRNSRLGTWGLASEQDEMAFMPYLLDESGHLLSSVTFWGIMGKEKDHILNKTKVGVPNPSGASETFCITALEMQLWGGIITTIRFGGFLDTVYSTGILYSDCNKLADSVVEQLLKEDNDYLGALSFVEKFSFEKVCQKWVDLFDAIDQGVSLDYLLKPQPSSLHKFEEFNRRIKAILPFGSLMPTTMFYRSLLLRIPFLRTHV